MKLAFRNAVTVSLALWLVAQVPVALAEDFECTPTSAIANGKLVICWKKPAATAGATKHLLVHFHGAPETVTAAFARSGLDTVLVVINFPGLSSAYATPFESDAGLFEQILQRAESAVPSSVGNRDAPRWERVTLSSFSAGYGAVREILKTPAHFDRISAVVAADSIYAGVKPGPDRYVNEQHMRDFLRFATMSADGKKTFIISHSAQPTPYASTTETADYLLQSLGISRHADASLQTMTMRQSSVAARGRFVVLGFEGQSGDDHLQHLRHVDLFWKRVDGANRIANHD